MPAELQDDDLTGDSGDEDEDEIPSGLDDDDENAFGDSRLGDDSIDADEVSSDASSVREDEDLEDDVDMFAPIDDTTGAFDEEDLEGGGGGMFSTYTWIPGTHTPSQSCSTRTSLILLLELHTRVLEKRVRARRRQRVLLRLRLGVRSAFTRKSRSG